MLKIAPMIATTGTMELIHGDFARYSAHNLHASTALEMPNMALRTSLTAPKDMLTEYMRIRNITARMIKIPVPSTTQPIVEVEALFVVIVFPDLIGLPLRIYKIENDLSRCHPTACVMPRIILRGTDGRDWTPSRR